MISNYGIKPTAFARIKSEQSIKLSRESCTCAIYNWLLQRMPAGKPQEVEGVDFEAYSGFSRWAIKAAIEKLERLGLIQIIKKYTARIWKVVVFDPDSPQLSQERQRSSASGDAPQRVEMLETEGSNPDSLVPTYKEDRDNRPGSVFSDFVSQDKESIQTLPQAQPLKDIPLVKNQDSGDDHLSAAAAKIESAIGKPLTPALKKLALEASLQVIEDAIAALQEAKTRREGVRDEVAYLIGAIRGEYTPRQPKAILGANLKAFGVWFDWAKLKGIVTASMRSGDGIDVMVGNAWVKFEDAIARFPLV